MALLTFIGYFSGSVVMSKFGDRPHEEHSSWQATQTGAEKLAGMKPLKPNPFKHTKKNISLLVIPTAVGTIVDLAIVVGIIVVGVLGVFHILPLSVSTSVNFLILGGFSSGVLTLVGLAIACHEIKDKVNEMIKMPTLSSS